jgi:hypothetical protein
MKNLTAKSLLREVRQLKKKAEATEDGWMTSLMAYSAHRSDGNYEGFEIAEYVTDQSKYVSKYFHQVMANHGVDLKWKKHSIDGGNQTSLSKIWAAESDIDNEVNWGFFDIWQGLEEAPYLWVSFRLPTGELINFERTGRPYNFSKEPIKQIRSAKNWLLGALAELDQELSNL